MSFFSHAQNVLSIAAVIGVVSLLLRYIYSFLCGPINAVPGPLYSRFTSLRYKYHAVKGQRVKYIHSLHQQYGPVVRVSPDEVSITDLPSIQEIYRVSTPFLKSEWYYHFAGRQPANMFTYRDAHAHRTRRSLLASPMSENALKKLEPTVNRNIQKAIDGMASEQTQTGVADIFKWFTYMATDIIGELSFAESFRMLDHPEPNQYYHDLKNLQKMGQMRTEIGNLVYLLGALRIQPFKEALAIISRISGYATQSVKRYEKHVEENPDDPKPTLFTKLYTKEADGVLSRIDLIREGTSYIVAGSDTTATTSTYIVYNVCKMPEIRAKLLKELSTLPENFSWDDVRVLPYLNNVITETLRLDGAVAGSLKRDVPVSGATLAGYHLPHGTIVSAQPYTVHRDPKIWTEPNKFDPDRWLDPTPDMNHAFLSFGSGTRVCIGLHLARDEMRYAIAKFFLAFPDAKVVESDQGMEQNAYFLMQPKAQKCLVDLYVSEKMASDEKKEII